MQGGIFILPAILRWLPKGGRGGPGDPSPLSQRLIATVSILASRLRWEEGSGLPQPARSRPSNNRLTPQALLKAGEVQTFSLHQPEK